MRAVVAMCLGLAISPAGHAADRMSQATLLNEYAGNICVQAQANPNATCDGNWSLFVQVGMNDIDRRCDSFLAWLDARRREKEPAAGAAISAQELSKVSGSSPTALDIVAVAFGLARPSQFNLNPQLLVSADHSTVQAIVLDGHRKFREKIGNGVVPDQPSAIDLLRDYLRLCMPATIEASLSASAPRRGRLR